MWRNGSKNEHGLVTRKWRTKMLSWDITTTNYRCFKMIKSAPHASHKGLRQHCQTATCAPWSTQTRNLGWLCRICRFHNQTRNNPLLISSHKLGRKCLAQLKKILDMRISPSDSNRTRCSELQQIAMLASETKSEGKSGGTKKGFVEESGICSISINNRPNSNGTPSQKTFQPRVAPVRGRPTRRCHCVCGNATTQNIWRSKQSDSCQGRWGCMIWTHPKVNPPPSVVNQQKNNDFGQPNQNASQQESWQEFNCQTLMLPSRNGNRWKTNLFGLAKIKLNGSTINSKIRHATLVRTLMRKYPKTTFSGDRKHRICVWVGKLFVQMTLAVGRRWH